MLLDDDALRVVLQAELGADWELRDRLARGRFAAVYRAAQRSLDRWVAVKVLTGAGGPLARARFERGALVLSHLEHPHIMRIYDFWERGPVCYQVLPLVRTSLAAALLHEGPFAPRAAARVLLELAAALDHAHRQGVVHRDVKPQHILLEDDERRVRLTDFGAALLVLPGMQAAGRAGVGTPAYMSPEQAEGRAELDGRSDLYALGAVGYELLTGSVPFDGPAERQLAAHRTRVPVDPAARRPGIPAELAGIVLRCLAKRPDERWASAAELAGALRAFLGEAVLGKR
jgi:eukaryotic-like serine/threonine-protein kinase